MNTGLCYEELWPHSRGHTASDHTAGLMNGLILVVYEAPDWVYHHKRATEVSFSFQAFYFGLSRYRNQQSSINANSMWDALGLIALLLPNSINCKSCLRVVYRAAICGLFFPNLPSNMCTFYHNQKKRPVFCFKLVQK